MTPYLDEHKIQNKFDRDFELTLSKENSNMKKLLQILDVVIITALLTPLVKAAAIEGDGVIAQAQSVS